jgi:3-oxoacyl-[acyl-carrier-protein] synthase III
MALLPDDVGIGSFVCSFGDLPGRAEDIPGFDAIWDSVSPNSDLPTMGCGSFTRMSGPVEAYVVDCVKRALADHATPAADVDHLVVATTDACLGLLGRDFTTTVLGSVGMVNCMPVVLSGQQCCGSVTALRYGWERFADPDVHNVVLVSLDFTPDDRDRIRSFALFGDAVTSCVLSRGAGNELRLLSAAINLDYSGLSGRDSFVSRQQVAQASFSAVLGDGGRSIGDIAKVFPTNLFKPLTVFGAAAVGVRQSALHFAETLSTYGHCGNCDWMINLADYRNTTGLRPGELYLAQASAPGFFACGLLEGI